METHLDQSAVMQSLKQSDEGSSEQSTCPMLQSEHGMRLVGMQEVLAYYERERLLKSTKYLLVGTIMGFIAIVYSLVINAAAPDELYLVNMYGEPFPSGYTYHPGSISEMVHDPSTPRGMVWYAFGLLAPALVLASWYPYRLRNVYMSRGIGFLPPPYSVKVSFAAARTFVPYIGMLCVILVRYKPVNLNDLAQVLTLPVHGMGASAFIAGFSAFEMYTLLWGRDIPFAAWEKTARWVCAIGALIGGLMFAAGMNLRVGPYGLCCDDVYRPVGMEAVRRARAHGLHTIANFDLKLISRATLHPNVTAPINHGLYDTATGWGLALKLIGFWGELSAGLSVLLGHLAIWYFCKERHIRLQDPVDSV